MVAQCSTNDVLYTYYDSQTLPGGRPCSMNSQRRHQVGDDVATDLRRADAAQATDRHARPWPIRVGLPQRRTRQW